MNLYRNILFFTVFMAIFCNPIFAFNLFKSNADKNQELIQKGTEEIDKEVEEINKNINQFNISLEMERRKNFDAEHEKEEQEFIQKFVRTSSNDNGKAEATAKRDLERKKYLETYRRNEIDKIINKINIAKLEEEEQSDKESNTKDYNKKLETVQKQILSYTKNPSQDAKNIISEYDLSSSAYTNNIDYDNTCKKDTLLSLGTFLHCIYDNKQTGKYVAFGDYENIYWHIMQSVGKNQSLLSVENTVIYVDGIAGLDGQSMKGKYYILEYIGIKQYTNILGSNRSIPSFKVIKQISL